MLGKDFAKGYWEYAHCKFDKLGLSMPLQRRMED